MKKSNFRIGGVILGMVLMASIVACGAATGKDTRYTNIEFGYSITLQPNYEITEDEANSTVTIGTSEGTAIEIVVIEGDGPFRNDDLDRADRSPE